jgi:hypothetical protein
MCPPPINPASEMVWCGALKGRWAISGRPWSMPAQRLPTVLIYSATIFQRKSTSSFVSFSDITTQSALQRPYC